MKKNKNKNIKKLKDKNVHNYTQKGKQNCRLVFESHEKYASVILCKLPIDITVLILYVGKLYT